MKQMQKAPTAQPQGPDQKIGMIERMNELFSEALTTRLFPRTDISCNWLGAATDALRHASPRGIDMSHEQFADLINAVESHDVKLTLFQFACISNNLEVTSADKLGLSLREYMFIMQE